MNVKSLLHPIPAKIFCRTSIYLLLSTSLLLQDTTTFVVTQTDLIDNSLYTAQVGVPVYIYNNTHPQKTTALCGKGFGNCPRGFKCSERSCIFKCVRSDSSSRSLGRNSVETESDFHEKRSKNSPYGGSCNGKNVKCGRGFRCKQTCKLNRCIKVATIEEVQDQYDSQNRTVILKLQNDFRNLVAGEGLQVLNGRIGNATNMQVLKWNQSLANAAFDDVDEKEHSFPTAGEPIKCDYGQNLEWTDKLTCNSSLEDIYGAAMNSWTNEKIHFPIEAANPYLPEAEGGPTYGHLAQLLWANTNQVGCAHARIYRSDSIDGVQNDYCRHYIRCSYYPSGVIESPFSMYIEGDGTKGPASNCKIVSLNYLNLCDDVPNEIVNSVFQNGTTWTPSKRDCREYSDDTY